MTEYFDVFRSWMAHFFVLVFYLLSMCSIWWLKYFNIKTISNNAVTCTTKFNFLRVSVVSTTGYFYVVLKHADGPVLEKQTCQLLMCCWFFLMGIKNTHERPFLIYCNLDSVSEMMFAVLTSVLDYLAAYLELQSCK